MKSRRRNPLELLLLNPDEYRRSRRNPAATRPLTMLEAQAAMIENRVPKLWRTRFMQGLNVEWNEHGGGIDAHSVGALVIDHLTEDPNYYRRARQNPEGTASFTPQTQTPAFRRWFGDSKVVDENGEPLVVYHGTISGGFSAFTVPENDRSKPPGIFFTDYLPMAKAYTYSDFYGTLTYDDDGRPVITKRVVIDEDREKDPTPDFPLAARAEVEGVVPVGIYAVFLRIENPLVVDAEGNHWQEIPVYDEHGNRNDTEDTNYLVRRALRTGLYDGVIIKNVVDYNLKRFGEPATVYVVFDPKQIKSAHKNIGAFDPNDPDIRRNPAATRPLSMVEVQQVMVDLAVPKLWRTRFMQGLETEWREHGGSPNLDPVAIGALVLDHLIDDLNYYRK